MKIIKRNGAEEIFDINKIVNAIKKANREMQNFLPFSVPPGAKAKAWVSVSSM